MISSIQHWYVNLSRVLHGLILCNLLFYTNHLMICCLRMAKKNITNFWTPPSEAIRVCLNIVFYHKFMAFSCLHRVHSSISEWEPPNSSHLKGKWWSINENSGIRGFATNCQVPMLYFMFKPPTSDRSPVLLVNRAMISRELLVRPSNSHEIVG